MKVLLINGSPNENGCTYTALSEVEKELKKEKIETEIINIGDNPIRGCNGCGICKQESNNKCVFDDDIVNIILEKMPGCNGLVIGSPVYFASANGSLISLLDRVFYAGNCFAYKPGACVVSARRAGTTATFDQLNKYFSNQKMPIVTSQYWNMVHGNNPQEVKQDKEGMQTMRTLGRNMAWLLKCIEKGKEAGIKTPEAEEIERTNFIR